MDEHLGLLIRKGDPLTVRVVMHLDAYRALMTVSRARRPYEVAGVLIGTWAGFQDQHWVTVEDVMPLRLVPAEDDLAPDEEDIQRLTDRLTRARPDSDKDGSSDNNGEGHQSSSSGHEAEEGLRVVGSFYADPDLAARPPRLNLYGVHQALAPDTQLFLLIDPAINEGVYYLWESRYLAPVGGFYELLPPGASPEIPWGGGWSGADLARGLDREVPEASGDLIAVSTSLPPAYASRHRLPSFLLAALEHGLGATRHSRLAWGLAVAVELMLFSLLFLVGTLALPGGPAFHPDIAIVSTSASAPPLSQVLPLQGGGVPANPPDTATPDVSVRQAEATRAAQVTRVTRPQPTQTSVPALAPTLPPPPPSISTFPPPTPTGEGPAQASVFESNHTLTLPDSACTGGYTLPAGLYRARSAHLVLGPLAPDPRSRMLDCPFNLNKNAGGPIHLAYITLAGLDSPDEARTPIKVALNGKSIYEGPDPLENSAPAAGGRPDPWNSYSLPVDPNLLLQGANTITITNLAPSPTVPTSLTSANLPFLVLDYAAVTWMR